MQEYLDYYIDEVNRVNRSFTEALDELVEIERKHNQTRREQANVKTANFPFIKTVEDFDFDFQPDINKKEILELNTLRFLDRHDNILFVGSSGTGEYSCAVTPQIRQTGNRLLGHAKTKITIYGRV